MLNAESESFLVCFSVTAFISFIYCAYFAFEFVNVQPEL